MRTPIRRWLETTLGWSSASTDLDAIVETAYAWHRSQVELGR